MDRTTEFFQYASTLKIPANIEKPLPSSNPNDELRSFHNTASDISHQIRRTAKLLGELTNLVRRRGLVDTGGDEARVNELVVILKSNITDLNSKLDNAAIVMEQEKRKRGASSQSAQEVSNIVGQLQTEFVETTAGFKNVLIARSDQMKDQDDWKKSRKLLGSTSGGSRSLSNALKSNKARGSHPQFPTISLTSTTVTTTPAGESTSSALPRPQGVLGGGLGGGNSGGTLRQSPVAPNLYHNQPPLSLKPNINDPNGIIQDTTMPVLTPLDIQRMDEEMGQNGGQQMTQLIPQQNYFQERADAMSLVESNIAELGTIFNKLAVMVNEHKELVQRVEDNVEDANESINSSLMALTNTLESLKTNKALAMKVSGVLILFIIMFVTFFA